VYGTSRMEVMLDSDQSSLHDLIEEFFEKNTDLPNPEHQPKQVEFRVRSFLFGKGMLKELK
jgi:hypothetical protein